MVLPINYLSSESCYSTISVRQTLLFAGAISIGLMLLAELFLSSWLLAAPLAALCFSGVAWLNGFSFITSTGA